MNYIMIKKNDVANGPGVRVSLFVSGCEFYCEECFNQEAWDFKAGKKFTNNTYNEIKEELSKEYIQGITFLGGEPLHPNNTEGVARIIMKIRKDFGYSKDIWVYSGSVVEELYDRSYDDFALLYILNNIDVLVDGLFVNELKNPSLRFRGSSNQRILRMENGKVKEMLED